MSVNPGFGGQGFIHSTLRKIERVRERIEASGKSIRLEVDGGVQPDNIADIARAGADTFVAGSATFGLVAYGQEDGRAHIGNPVNNAAPVCRTSLEKQHTKSL